MSERRERFQELAQERVQRLEQLLFQLEDAPGSGEEVFPELLRELHTLKGEARILELAGMAGLAHRTEDLLGAAQRGEVALNPQLFDLALESLDGLRALALGAEGAFDAEELGRRLGEAAAAGDGKGDQPAKLRTPAAAAARAPGRRVLRVDPGRLDALSELTGELLVLRERALHTSRRLRRLHRELRAAPTTEPTPWLDELGQLAARSSDEAFAGAHTIAGLGEQLRALRLAPLRGLLDELRRPVRDLGRSLGKELRVDVEVGEVEVDQSLLEALREPLLHLLRNAVGHGIEPPGEREAAGKDREACLTLGARQVGSGVIIEVADDGRGIDPEAVRRRAVAQGLLAEDAPPLAPGALHELIFLSGFSTAELSELSGRGVGLDVVRRRVEECRGSVGVESEPGQGTRFVLRVPLGLATAQALICEVASNPYAVVADAIERVLRYDPSALRSQPGGPGLLVEEATLPLCLLSNLLSLDEEAPRPGAQVVLVRDRERRLALLPQRVLGQQEVALRPLDPFIAQMELVQSSCVLGDGRVALALSVPALLRRATRLSDRASTAG